MLETVLSLLEFLPEPILAVVVAVGAVVTAATALVKALQVLVAALEKVALMTPWKQDDEILARVSRALLGAAGAMEKVANVFKPLSLRGRS